MEESQQVIKLFTGEVSLACGLTSGAAGKVSRTAEGTAIGLKTKLLPQT
jgi:hypothetical protein